MKNFNLLFLVFSFLLVMDAKQIFSESNNNFPHQGYPFRIKDCEGPYVYWKLQYGNYDLPHGVEPMDYDFKNYPNILFLFTKEGKLTATLRGVEKIKNSSGNGFYCVSVRDLKVSIHSDYADISFEVGERTLYSEPLGLGEKGKKKVGVGQRKLFYAGKINRDSLHLSCNGKDCLDREMIFDRDYP